MTEQTNAKQPAPVKQSGLIIVAVERGFLGGAMVEPGAKLRWPADKKLPKWAAAEGDARLVKAKRVITAADLKPQAINDAVKAKAENLRDEFA